MGLVEEIQSNGYSIYGDGGVFSNKRNIFLKQKTQSNGYQSVTLSFGKSKKTCNVHRLVALKYIPNPENKPHVNHIDGDKSNNHLGNLEWVTPKENTKHSIEKGLQSPQGETNANAKLTLEQVKEIKILLTQVDVIKTEIAKKYGVSVSAIHDIDKKRNWAWV